MIPRLKIVARSNIVPLMETKADKTTRIMDFIRDTGTITSPLVLAHISERKYLLLDDGDILTAAGRLGIKFLPAQITPPSAAIEVTGRVSADLNPTLIDEYARRWPRDVYTDMPRSDLRKYPAGLQVDLTLPDNGERLILFKGFGPHKLSPRAIDFFRYLSRRIRFKRYLSPPAYRWGNLKSTENGGQLKLLNLEFSDLPIMARYGWLFPPGLLRFDSGNRIIGINYPVTVLNERAPVREKERFLRDLLNYRLECDQSEYIPSGVYLLGDTAKK